MRNKDLTEKACRNCTVQFQPKNYNQEFCSDACRNDWHNDIKAKAIEQYRSENVVVLWNSIAAAFKEKGIRDFTQLTNQILAEKLGLNPEEGQ